MDDPTQMPIIHDDKRPITVGGWMRTLPPFENAPNWGLNYGVENQLCKSLDSALCVLVENTSNFTRGYGYYLGVLDFLRGKVMDEARSNHYRDGYFAAKAAFEAQKVMDDPTTIRGWLILLPEIDGCPPWMETPYLDSPCDDLAAAVAHVYMEAPPKWEQFWLGVSTYLDGDEFPSANSDDCMRGYDAAKAAFKAQKQPEPIEQAEASPIVTDGMASMPWADFSALTEKAALCDTLKAENERLKVKADAFDTSLCGDLLELQRKAAAYDQIVEIMKLRQK